MTYINAQYTFASVTSDVQLGRNPMCDTRPEVLNFLKELGDFLSSLRQPEYYGGPQCGTVSPPSSDDCCHPEGSLKVDSSGVITTPGGYKIEQVGQYEWKITGPDGKWTRCWGDPHIQESDRSNEATAWDFKRDSTFLLPDGTRINVTTKPYNNMTVTASLEVINGRDRVLVTDIDKGKGKVGEVTHDGLAHSDLRCGRDVFVMGRETDDWYYQGREVIGSNNGGESFKLGDGRGGNSSQLLSQIEGFALRLMSALYRNWPTGTSEEADNRRDRVTDQITSLNELFRTISSLRSLNDRIALERLSSQCC